MRKKVAKTLIVSASFLFSFSVSQAQEDLGDLALKQVEELEEIVSQLKSEFKTEEEKKLARKEGLNQALKNPGTKIRDPDHFFYLKKTTGLSPGELDLALEGTPLEGLGQAFQRAEEEYGVNSLFLIGLANHESNYGKSKIARDKNNLFGFNANDSNPYGLASGYDSKEDCILKVAEKINRLYLVEDGRYYMGAHLSGVNIRYSSDQGWAEKTSKHMVQVAEKIVKNWKE